MVVSSRSTSTVVAPDRTDSQLRCGSQAKQDPYASFGSKRAKRFEAKVTPNWFRFYWIVFVLIFALDGLYLAGVSKLYYWMLYQPAVMITIQTQLHLLPIPTLRGLVWVFPVLSAGHLLSVLEILVHSIQRRQLVLTGLGQNGQPENGPRHGSLQKRRSMLASLTRQVQNFVAVWVYPFLAVEGKHFELWFTTQEIFQIVSQTYQCYSLSRLVTTKWMNQLAVLCTFLNCVSSSVIRLLVPKDIPRQRLLCVLIDCCLAFVQAVVIPFVIFYRYYQVYDTRVYYFPEELVYNYVWYIEAVHSLDQIFIVSYTDFLMTALPHLDFLRSLREISHWIRTTDTLDTHILSAVVPVTSKRRVTTKVKIRSTASAPTESFIESSQALTLMQAQRTKWGISPSLLYSALCVCHGCVIVILHFAAKNNDPIASGNCLFHLNPWFARRFACSWIEVNCVRSGIQGNASELTSILQRFDGASASGLMFSDCPRLEMPTKLLDFPALIGMNLYNCTLIKWTSEAALSADHHPVMLYLDFEKTNMRGIPEGILGDNLPNTFSDIEFYRTNVSALPADIGSKWFRLNSLYLEFCQLRHLPESLSLMPLWYFSAVGNQIDWVDDALFENNTFSQFLLSNNPIQRFPTIGDLTFMSVLSFEYTQVEEVPDQVIDWVLDRLANGLYLAHSAYGSPFCANETGVENPRLTQYKAFACNQDRGTKDGYFPIATIEDQLLS